MEIPKYFFLSVLFCSIFLILSVDCEIIQKETIPDVTAKFFTPFEKVIPISSFYSDDNSDTIYLTFENVPSWMTVSRVPPNLIGKYEDDTSHWEYFFDVFMYEDLLYCVANLDSTNTSFLIFNVSNISNIELLTNYIVESSEAFLVDTENSVAYIPERAGYLQILDVRDPRNVTKIGDNSHLTGHPGGPYQTGLCVFKKGDSLYVCDYPRNVVVYNVSYSILDKITLIEKPGLGGRHAFDIAVNSKDIAVIADKETTKIYDVSGAGVELKDLGQAVWYCGASSARLKPNDEDIGFVGYYKFCTLKIADIADKNNVTQLAEVNVGESRSGLGRDIEIGGPNFDFVFASSGETTFWVYDVSNLRAPEKIMEVTSTLGNVHKGDVFKNYYLTGNTRGIEIYEYGNIKLHGIPGTGDDNFCAETKTIQVLVRSSMNSSNFLRANFSVALIGGNNIIGTDCKVLECNGTLSNDTSSVCSGYGNCTFTLDPFGICECEGNYNGSTFCEACNYGHVGPFCNVTACFGIIFNSTEVCSSHGNCTSPNHCECDENYGYLEDCGVWKCNGVFKNNSETCSNHGICLGHDNCDCTGTGSYTGEFCEIWSCFNISHYNTSKVCSGHGTCTSRDICKCKSSDYSGWECEYFECFGHAMNSSTMCNSHGSCIDHDTCDCIENYKDLNHETGNYDCGNWKCHDVSRLSDFSCKGNGECILHNNCSCKPKFSGENCQYWTCHNISSDKAGEVCGNGKGLCVKMDSCQCFNGYSSRVFGGVCDIWLCGEVTKNSENVCNGRGECVDSQKCVCEEGYIGNLCQTFNCNGKDKSDREVCSGNGVCDDPEECLCDTGFGGDDCDVNIIGIVSGSIFGAGTILVSGIVLIFCVFSCLCVCLFGFCILIVCFCCVLLFLVLLGCFTCCIGFISLRQKLSLKKFGRLRNVDILLKEQEIEDDISIAHIKVNKTLFEIAYDELKVINILGEGGSESTVYKCDWNNIKVAFKCFKTRMLCENQDRFDEFEKEVEIFSSISHPSIVRFYGCTMKPPRVGIVMEFCENGELFDFLRKYRLENSCSYPMKEKIRMAHEVVAGMEYLHTRNIIHRDLKCENVLLNKICECKIMDFGLSKITERMSQVKTKRVGTSFYMAPEVLLEGDYSEKCDVFSFSMLCYIIITEDPNPFSSLTSESFGIEFRIANDPNFRPDVEELRKFLGSEYSWIVGVVERSWTADAKKRPSFGVLNEMFQKTSSMVEEEEEEEVERKVKVKKMSYEELERENSELKEEIENLKKGLLDFDDF